MKSGNNSSCVSFLKDHSAINALIPGGCCIILGMTVFPVSINYYSSNCPSFRLLGKAFISLEAIITLLILSLYISLTYQFDVNTNLI